MSLNSPDQPLFDAMINCNKRAHPFAPQMSLIQATLKKGRAASGLATTSEDALEKCLSEVAETLAIEVAGPLSNVHPLQFGLASHPISDIAKQSAFYEAVERRDVLAWWRGDIGAVQVKDIWLAENGVSAWIDTMRANSDIRRRTAVWLLESSPATTIVAHSISAAHQEPILGFGTASDAKSSVFKALHELILMETIIAEIQAERGGHGGRDLKYEKTMVELYAEDLPKRLPKGPQISAVACPNMEHISDLKRTTIFDELTLAAIGRPVWLAQLGANLPPPPAFGEHPYISGSDRRAQIDFF